MGPSSSRRRVKRNHNNNATMFKEYKWILFFAEFKVTLKPRLSESSRYTNLTVTYEVDYINLDGRITKPENVPISPKIYGENATVPPITLRFSTSSLETTPLRFQFNIKWALKNDSFSLPGCIIDPRIRSEMIEKIERKKDIQSLLLITYNFKYRIDCNM